MKKYNTITQEGLDNFYKVNRQSHSESVSVNTSKETTSPNKTIPTAEKKIEVLK